MKTGIINFNPSLKTQALAKKIWKMKKTMTYDQIVIELGYTRAYLVALHAWYIREILGNNIQK